MHTIIRSILLKEELKRIKTNCVESLINQPVSGNPRSQAILIVAQSLLKWVEDNEEELP